MGKEEKLPSQVLKVQIGSLKRWATGSFILLQLLLEYLERTKHSTQYFVKTCCRHVLGGFHSINSCTIRKPHCLGGGSGESMGAVQGCAGTRVRTQMCVSEVYIVRPASSQPSGDVTPCRVTTGLRGNYSFYICFPI